MATYDDQNIFARILRGEIPNDTVTETEHTLVFRDIRPQAPVHVLVIPKGAYVSFEDFAANASEVEIMDFMRTAAKVSHDLGISMDTGKGFRAIANSGEHSHQEVPHFHLHLLAGRPLGAMLVHPEA
ncbi:HIT domain-containing protein [Paracoccus aminophilus]|uniref:Diadenosine tetraphosphate n=1 Tax=Paracoccus aminophilus JCM 7686 TaxID=1367847 RepID=S5XLU0_PARAH|nr:HIT domain-containing protein [Paracoccus aminophilus]AGT08209.1 diadenosine tetraphosphate [Paracoccus aminophilus JCM 7686]